VADHERPAACASCAMGVPHSIQGRFPGCPRSWRQGQGVAAGCGSWIPISERNVHLSELRAGGVAQRQPGCRALRLSTAKVPLLVYLEVIYAVPPKTSPEPSIFGSACSLGFPDGSLWCPIAMAAIRPLHSKVRCRRQAQNRSSCPGQSCCAHPGWSPQPCNPLPPARAKSAPKSGATDIRMCRVWLGRRSTGGSGVSEHGARAR